MLVYRINHEAKRIENLGPDGVWQVSRIGGEHEPTRVYRFVRSRLVLYWPELIKAVVLMQNHTRFSFAELRAVERAARKKIRSLDARQSRSERNARRYASNHQPH